MYWRKGENKGSQLIRDEKPMAGTLDDNRAEYEKVRIAPGPHDDAAIKESELVKTSKKHAIYIYIYIL